MNFLRWKRKKELTMKAHDVLPSPSWRDNDDAIDLKKSVRVIKIISQTAQCFHSMVDFLVHVELLFHVL